MAMTAEEKRIARNEASKRWYAAHKAKNAIKTKRLAKAKSEPVKKEKPKKTMAKPADDDMEGFAAVKKSVTADIPDDTKQISDDDANLANEIASINEDDVIEENELEDSDNDSEFLDDEDDEDDVDDEDDILGGAGREERAWGRGREEMFDEYYAMGCDDE